MKAYGQFAKVVKFSCCDARKQCRNVSKKTSAVARVWRKRARAENKKLSSKIEQY